MRTANGTNVFLNKNTAFVMPTKIIKNQGSIFKDNLRQF
jgi:hypothetical protein